MSLSVARPAALSLAAAMLAVAALAAGTLEPVDQEPNTYYESGWPKYGITLADWTTRKRVDNPGAFKEFIQVSGEPDYVRTERGTLYPLEDPRRMKLRDEETIEDFKAKHAFFDTLRPLNATSNRENPCNSHTRVTLIDKTTPFKDQLGRRTSSQMAVISALESAYARLYNINEQLSVEFLTFVQMSTAQTWRNETKFDNECAYWAGGSTLDAMRALEYYGTTKASVVPYLSDTKIKSVLTPEMDVLQRNNLQLTQKNIDMFNYNPKFVWHQPDTLRQMVYGVSSWVKLRQEDVSNVCTLERILSSGVEVVVDVTLQWKRVHGIMVFDPTVERPGGQSLVILGYDHAASYFIVKNSWGGTQPEKVSYLFMRRCALQGAVIRDVIAPWSAEAYNRAMGASWLGNWKMDWNGIQGSLTIRRLAPFQHIGTYQSDRDGIESAKVEARFRNSFRTMEMHLGTARYDVFAQYDKAVFASGSDALRPSANGVSGVLLSRTPIPFKPLGEAEMGTESFDRSWLLGTWTLYWGNEVATVKLGPSMGTRDPNTGERSVGVEFVDARNVSRSARAKFLSSPEVGADEHAVDVSVLLPRSAEEAQFLLYYHRLERRVASGLAVLTDGIWATVAYQQPQPAVCPEGVEALRSMYLNKLVIQRGQDVPNDGTEGKDWFRAESFDQSTRLVFADQQASRVDVDPRRLTLSVNSDGIVYGVACN